MSIIKTNITLLFFNFKYFLAIDPLLHTIAVQLRKKIGKTCHVGLKFSEYSILELVKVYLYLPRAAFFWNLEFIFCSSESRGK